MKSFDQEVFNSFILEHNVIGFFDKPITLKSGRKSQWYVNWRTISSDVFLIDKLSDFLLDFITDLKIYHNGLYGVQEGATKLGVISTYKWALKQPDYKEGKYFLSMGRGKPKEHGSPLDRFFVGAPKGNIIIVEDVTTTGGSLVEAIDHVREAGASVVAAIGLTNRMMLTDDNRSLEQTIKEKGVNYYAMSEATKLLPLAIKRFKASSQLVENIKQEFIEFGIKQISLEDK